MSESLVRMTRHDHVATLILNRPDKRNALNRALLSELSQAFDDLHQEKGIRAVILTGAGTAFCAGMDLAEMRETSQMERPQDRWHEDAMLYHDLLWQMLRFPKTLIAAVNGPAVAGGAGLILGCDVVLASDAASFGLPEPLRGIVAGLVAPLLVFRIGAGHAAYLLTTAERVDAPRAQQMGLFHELIDADKLWPRAKQLGDQAAQCAPQAIQLTKRILNETIGEMLESQLSAGAAASAAARTTESAAEGLAAFLEKREPKWP